jgi:hypothetical protein
MGARLGFADVLLSKLADVPPPVALGEREPSIVSPSWVHRLEPLRAVSAQVLHARYPQPASAAPAAGGIPVEASSATLRGGSSATMPPKRPRTPREQLGLAMLNRLGAGLSSSATDDDVRRAYRRLVRETHPDLHQSADAGKLRAVLSAWDLFTGRAADAA